MPTIADVARQAGVSVSTVSYALSGSRPISDKTKQRIYRAIDELGFQPNLVARSLVSRRTYTLAVVASRLDYYGPSRMVVGVEQQAGELGYSLLLTLLHKPDDPNVAPVLDALAARQVDGIIWAASQIGDNLAWVTPERLAHLPPMVFLAKPGPGVTTVTVDNMGGAIQATQHLLAQGRRKIGLITGPLAYRAARERHAGWQHALEEADLTPNPSLVVEGDWLSPSGAAGARELFRRHSDLDAIFACNDDMALGVLNTAHAAGRRVPTDLAVVGFDNTPTSGHFWPPLTTIHTHAVDAGRLAVRELQSLIEARQANEPAAKPVTRSLATELVIRESSVVE